MELTVRGTPRLRAPKGQFTRSEQKHLYEVRLKAKVIAAYGGRCACCGLDEPSILTIDHVADDGAAHRRELAQRSGGRYYGHAIYYELQRLDFPKDRFRLLCMNCNWSRRRDGACFHERVIANLA